METVTVEVLTYLLFLIGTFIVYAFLLEFGFFTYIIEVIYTHPNFTPMIYLLGDIIYGIGIGIVGSAGFNYYATDMVELKALIYGIMVISIGSILKEFFKKDNLWK